MNIIRVASSEMPELDMYVGKKEIRLRRYYEPQPGIFIAESRNVIDIALRQGYEPISVLCTEKMLNDEILCRMGEIPVYVVDSDEAAERLGYVLTGNIAAAMRRKVGIPWEVLSENAKRIVVLEDVENPTNIGAVFRSAAALGTDAVILSPACADPLYRRALRVSVGNTLLVPWAYMCSDEAEWKTNGIKLLKKKGFTVVAMALSRDNIDIDDIRLKTPEKIALIMGNEGKGLAASTIEACDYVAKIPMERNVDSLNVSVAAGIAMWELGKRGNI